MCARLSHEGEEPHPQNTHPNKSSGSAQEPWSSRATRALNLVVVFLSSLVAATTLGQKVIDLYCSRNFVSVCLSGFCAGADSILGD